MSSVFILLAAVTCTDNPGKDALIANRTAVQECYDKLAFSSTFLFRSGTAKTIDQALRGEFDSAGTTHNSNRSTKASGRLIKLKEKYRVQLNYEKPVVEVPSIDGKTPRAASAPLRSGLLKDVNYDEISDGNIMINRTPAQGRLGDAATVSECDAEFKKLPVAGIRSRYFLTPLNPMTTDLFGPLSMWGTEDIALKTDTSISVSSPDSDRTQIVIEVKMPSPQKRTVLLSTKYSLPVVESIRHIIVAPNGFQHEYVCRLSDFVECTGGPVARHVLYAAKIDPNKAVLMEEWVSLDLGDVQPTDKDFVLDLPENTSLGGLTTQPRFGPGRSLDPSQIDRSQLGNVPKPGPNFRPKAAE
jgi:hypothetical protein